MTRINLVKVEDLADQHLFAEWREIKMIPAKVKKLWAACVNEARDTTPISASSSKIFQDRHISGIPEKYTLSTGHVRFFYDKMLFLSDRYKLLTEELHKREFKIAEHDARALFFDGMSFHTRTKEWKPSPQEIMINVERIEQRLNERPDWYKYYGEVKPPSFFTDRYKHDVTFNILAGI